MLLSSCCSSSRWAILARCCCCCCVVVPLSVACRRLAVSGRLSPTADCSLRSASAAAHSSAQPARSLTELRSADMGNCVQASDRDESQHRGDTWPIRRPLSTEATPLSASSADRSLCARCPELAAHRTEPLTGSESPSAPPHGVKQLSRQCGGESASASASASQSLLLTTPPSVWLSRQWSASASATLSAPVVDLAELRPKGHKCHGQRAQAQARTGSRAELSERLGCHWLCLRLHRLTAALWPPLSSTYQTPTRCTCRSTRTRLGMRALTQMSKMTAQPTQRSPPSPVPPSQQPKGRRPPIRPSSPCRPARSAPRRSSSSATSWMRSSSATSGSWW